jgi:hypothetical protein
MPAWLDITLVAPLMAEPPTPGAHVPLEFERRARSRLTEVRVVLRHGVRARVTPSRLAHGLVSAHDEGLPIRVKVNESFTQRTRTKVELHLEIDTPWAREQPSNPAPETPSPR